MIAIIDAFDSFTWNLAQAFQGLGASVTVLRADVATEGTVAACGARALVLSPGPGRPEDCEAHMRIAASGSPIPVLGVCLGHQALVAASGGRVVHAREPLHGEAVPVSHDGEDLFEGLENGLAVARYHSLIADGESLPADWRVTARTRAGEIMAIAHRTRPRWGVQFHPESILTPAGPAILHNFLRLSGLVA